MGYRRFRRDQDAVLLEDPIIAVVIPKGSTGWNLPTSNFTQASQRDSFVEDNPNIGQRNIQLISTTKPLYFRSDVFPIPANTTDDIKFTAGPKPNKPDVFDGLPKDTKIALLCEPLGINSTFTVGTSPDYSVTVKAPSSDEFVGTIRTRIFAPAGSAGFPKGVHCFTEYQIGDKVAGRVIAAVA